MAIRLGFGTKREHCGGAMSTREGRSSSVAGGAGGGAKRLDPRRRRSGTLAVVLSLRSRPGHSCSSPLVSTSPTNAGCLQRRRSWPSTIRTVMSDPAANSPAWWCRSARNSQAKRRTANDEMRRVILSGPQSLLALRKKASIFS